MQQAAHGNDGDATDTDVMAGASVVYVGTCDVSPSIDTLHVSDEPTLGDVKHSMPTLS